MHQYGWWQNINNFNPAAYNLIFDGHRMKKIGLEAWLIEQEERIKDGFHYYATVRTVRSTYYRQ